MQGERTPKPVSRRLRFEVLRRDDYTCRYCGAKAPDFPLTVDHVVPVALGGTNDPANLAAACRACNAGKSSIAPDSPIVDNVADDALRWSRAMAQAAAAQALNAGALENYVGRVNAAWKAWNWEYKPCERIDGEYRFGESERREWERPTDWRASVERFFAQGLEVEVICRAIDAAMTARNVRHDDLWRYVCGICWRRLRERQELARELIDTGAVA